MLLATEIKKSEVQPLRSIRRKTEPVIIDGIRQKFLHRLTAPVDAKINGIFLRLPVGLVLSVTSSGATGHGGSLQADIEFVGANGEKYRATRGTHLRIIAS